MATLGSPAPRPLAVPAGSAAASTAMPADELALLLQDPPARPWRHVPAVGGVVLVHIAALWGLMQVDAVREAMQEAAPIMVELLSPPPPPPPVQPPPPPPPPPPPQRVLPPPKPAPVIAAPPAPTPEPPVFEAPPPPVEPPPAMVPVEPAPAPAPAPPAPAPTPVTVSITQVQYVRPPSPVYPSLSDSRGETGLVLIKVLVDATGQPRQMTTLASSGFQRLDASALAAVRATRFKPYTVNGVATEFWVEIPIVFEMER